SEGRILVTSYTTYGTPLIRYDIGDSVKLADTEYKCTCGSNFPVVLSIQGRSTDYILSKEHGRVNLGNLSNSTKDIEGIICFQIIQNNLDNLELKIVSNEKFTNKQKNNFIKALKERVGDNININIDLVEKIPKERSGKFRIVKNNLVKE